MSLINPLPLGIVCLTFPTPELECAKWSASANADFLEKGCPPGFFYCIYLQSFNSLLCKSPKPLDWTLWFFTRLSIPRVSCFCTLAIWTKPTWHSKLVNLQLYRHSRYTSPIFNQANCHLAIAAPSSGSSSRSIVALGLFVWRTFALVRTNTGRQPN